MKAKNNQGITKIKYGEIHIYYPLKFDSAVSFDELCEKVKKSSLFFSEEYHEKVMNALGKSLVQTTESLNSEYAENDSVHFEMRDFEKYKYAEVLEQNVNGENLRLELNAKGSSIEVRMVNMELEALQERVVRMQQEYECSSRFYGKRYSDSQERFILLPLKVKLNNGKSVWLYAALFVFANNMGTLKLELPIMDVDTLPLKMYMAEQYMSEVTCTWNSEFENKGSFGGIVQFYLKALFEDIGVEFWKYENKLQHTVLVDFDGIPTRINNIPDSVQEDLYRIVAAPVPDLPCTSYKKDAQEYLRKYSWGDHNMKYVAKSTGGCLSFVDQDLLDYCAMSYKTQTNLSVLDDADYLPMCNQVARDLQLNSEMALIILLLKKINHNSNFYQKMMSPRDLAKIKTEYWKNNIFICEMQEGCYGSVSEQISAFESMMPHYMKQELTDAKMASLDGILREEENKKIENFQNFISIGSFLLTLVFGLPSIYEAIGILRKLCSFISFDIPYITQENLSVVLWIVMSVILGVKVFRIHFQKDHS